MNTSLLRLARKYKGVRRWDVPGFANVAKIVPAGRGPRGWGASFYWPARDEEGELQRGVDLNRYQALARHVARELLK